jgi:hypothetical protein
VDAAIKDTIALQEDGFLYATEARCTPAQVPMQLTASPRDDSLWMSFPIGRPGSFDSDAGAFVSTRECFCARSNVYSSPELTTP